MIVCPDCGTEYSEQAKFCIHCGTRNPNRLHIGARFWITAAVLFGLFLALLVTGNVFFYDAPGGRSTVTQICSRSADAAHYIATTSTDADDVARVTDRVIAEHKYPLLGKKAVASIGMLVRSNRGVMTPDQISAQLRSQCKQRLTGNRESP